MVDIHAHILWGLDDGPESLAESLAMLRAAAEAGTTDIVATPHANGEYPFDEGAIVARIAELAAEAHAPRLHRGCDFHLSAENIDDALRNPARYTIDGKSGLLVEFPDFFIPPSMGEVFERFREIGLTPVITHPERNAALLAKMDLLAEWVRLGCLCQVTALSLTGGFGREAEEAGWELLERGLAQIVASDAHDPERRHPRLDDARRLVVERLGDRVAERVFVLNPGFVMRGEAAPAAGHTGEPESRKKRWFGLWG